MKPDTCWDVKVAAGRTGVTDAPFDDGSGRPARRPLPLSCRRTSGGSENDLARAGVTPALQLHSRSSDRRDPDQALDRQRDPVHRAGRHGRRLRHRHSRLLQAVNRSATPRASSASSRSSSPASRSSCWAAASISRWASIFALANFAAVGSFLILEQPVWVAFVAAMLTGLVFGCINGYLVGYMRLRAFLTTLVTLIIGRAVFDILVVDYGTAIQSSMMVSDLWDFIGDGTVYGFSIAVISAARDRDRRPCRDHALAARLAHPRGRRLAPLGLQFRHPRQAHRVHDLRRSPASVAASPGFLIACRLSGAGPGTGAGLEIAALTAAVVGGNSLGGGRGSIAKGIMGAIIVLVMTNGLIRLGFGTGTNQMVLGMHAGGRGDARHPLAEEPPQGAGRGLCRADLSPHGRDAVRAAGLRLALCARRPARQGRDHRPRRARGAGGRRPRPRRSSLLRHAPRRRSSASSPPTTSARRCSPISAGSRSASPSTAPASLIVLRRRHGPLFDLEDRARSRSSRPRRGAP